MRLLIEAQKTYNICMNMNDVYAGTRGLSKKYPALEGCRWEATVKVWYFSQAESTVRWPLL